MSKWNQLNPWGAGFQNTGAVSPWASSSGVMYGSYVDASKPATGESEAEVAARETALGRAFALDMHFYGQPVPADGLPEADIAAGRTPIITTQFAWGQPTTFPGYTSVTGGAQNTLIDAWATYLKTLTAPAIVRLFQEQNGTWMDYGPGATGYSTGFANMWRYIWNRWKASGVDLGSSIQICWCPNTETNLSISAATTDASYPGDAYVDLIGVDLYNKDSTGGGVGMSFQAGFQTIYGRYASKGKGFLVPEFGCVDHKLDQRKNFFTAMSTYIKSGAVPLLRGVCYWDAVGTANDATTGSTFEYRTDQTTSGNPASATDSFNAWKAIGVDPAFQGALFGTPGTIISGGDTSGLHKSADMGDLFQNRDASLTATSQHAAAIEPHPTQTGRWFALMGSSASGGLWESTDNGDTWTNTSTGTANIYGNGALAGNSGASNSLLGPNHGEHPRSVGRLVTVDAANSRIYVATWNHGVYRGVIGATSGITSWTQIYSTANTYTRGITYDAGQDMLYFSTYSDPGSGLTTASGHVWRCPNPRAESPTWTQMTGSPMCCSTMLVIADRLYAVAHPITANLADRGLWYIDAAHNVTASAAWTKISGVPTATTERWMSLDGYAASGVTTLWAGSASDGAHSLCKAVSSGGAWTCTVYPTSSATVVNDIAGPNTPAVSWWMYVYRQSFMLGKPTFVASTIRINPQNHNEIFVFGRSGVWRTRDAGASWYPATKGLGATVTLTTICDPNKQGSVYIGLGDWSVLTSKDDLASIAMIPPATGSFSYSMCIDESVTPTALFTAASPRQDQTGYTSKVYSNLDPNGATNWVDTNLNVSNEIIVALTVVYSGANRVLLAGDSGGSLWRKVGAGSWTLVPATNMAPSGGIHLLTSDTQPFARDLTHGGTVYLYDRGSGIWRSTNAGLNWTRIWSHAAGNSSDQSGWVDTHPNSAHIIYVSDSTSVYKITDADTCAQDAATHVTLASAIGAKGPMAVDKVNNKIGVCDITATSKFWESDLSTISWVDKADSLYLNAAGSPQWLSYDRAGSAHVALSGNGVISQQAGANPFSPPAFLSVPTILGAAEGGNTVTTTDGTITGNPTPVVTRKWLLDGVDTGITAASFAIPDTTDDGKVLTVTNHAVNSQGTADAVSAASAAITTPADPAPVWTVDPSITGATAPSGQVGDTLTGVNGTVSPGSVTSRKWQTSATGVGAGTDIGGATSTTLDTTSLDAGSYVRYVAHAVNSGTTADGYSAWKGPLAPTAVPNTPPTLTLDGPSDVIILPATPQITATATDADGIDTVTASVNLAAPVALTATTGDDYAIDLGLLDPGAYTVDVQATDSNVSPLSTTVSASFTVIQPDDSGSGTGGGGELTISTDIVDINLRITQRGLA